MPLDSATSPQVWTDMHDTQPLVGIIVPCFNQGEFASECIESIRAQDYSNWRAVAVNDGSTDSTRRLLDEVSVDRIRVVHLETNLGLSKARNVALQCLPDAQFILSVDCDDTLDPDYVRKLVDVLRDDERLVLAHGTLKLFGVPNANGIESWPQVEYEPAKRYLQNLIPGSGSVMRADAVRAAGGWRSEFNRSNCEDWDLWLRLVEGGAGVRWVRDAIYHYRQHSASIMASHTGDRVLEMHRRLLEFHSKGIARTVGLPAFVERLLIPSLRERLRSGDWKRAFPLLKTLLTAAPLQTTAALCAHYGRRLLSRLGVRP
jgi:glycosyltransferase involved in cell wall biosynthesis